MIRVEYPKVRDDGSTLTIVAEYAPALWGDPWVKVYGFIDSPDYARRYVGPHEISAPDAIRAISYALKEHQRLSNEPSDS